MAVPDRTRPTIRRLPPLLVNQIAAGEVIERPASVVKELVENAVDAGARLVEVAIESGGRDLIRVSDDGDGIATEQLELAVAPHATSKIVGAGDLDAIATLGFRGEALASIASVSRLTIVSRPPGQEAASEIRVEGDEQHSTRPCGGRPGTSVTVRNLFFNTPARRRFLRTDRTESGRVCDVLETLAISHPAIGFELTVDGRPRLELPAAEDPRARVLAVVGRELEPELLEIDEADVWGLVGRPDVARPNARGLRTYLNGRPISDRTINHAVREAYRGLIPPDRYPLAVLQIRMDPSQVDVNVHPAKAEVRFRDPPHVHRAMRNAVATALRAADLVPSVDLGSGRSIQWPGRGGGAAPPSGSASQGGGASPRDFVDTLRHLDPREKGLVYSEMKHALQAEAPELLEAVDGATLITPGGSAAVRPVTEPSPHVADTMVLHDCFIVTRDGDDLLIIDQHALHERIMFERLAGRITDGPLESQRLLMPVTIEVDERLIERLEPLQPLLRRLGVEAEPIGPRAVAVHAYTSLLFERKVEAEPFMRWLLDRGDELARAGDPEAALHEVLDMMACKAAVKAGDRLSADELDELLRLRREVERSSRCPHGRPTTLRLTRADLERQFGRR